MVSVVTEAAGSDLGLVHITLLDSIDLQSCFMAILLGIVRLEPPGRLTQW